MVYSVRQAQNLIGVPNTKRPRLPELYVQCPAPEVAWNPFRLWVTNNYWAFHIPTPHPFEQWCHRHGIPPFETGAAKIYSATRVDWKPDAPLPDLAAKIPVNPGPELVSRTVEGFDVLVRTATGRSPGVLLRVFDFPGDPDFDEDHDPIYVREDYLSMLSALFPGVRFYGKNGAQPVTAMVKDRIVGVVMPLRLVTPAVEDRL